MKLLHVSFLTNNKASGIASIVPLHVKWQACYGTVGWLNLNSTYVPDANMLSLYRYMPKFSRLECNNLDLPFDKPDLVIFHGIFFYRYCKIASQLRRMKIPYIVAPHGSLTKSSIRKKFIKKIIGFTLFFNKFVAKANAIQYLTNGEYIASGCKWNSNFIVVPNGCEIPELEKKNFNNSRNLVGVFIGRKSIYYKGLDLLIEACKEIRRELEKFNCRIQIYGPDERGADDWLRKKITNYNLKERVFLFNGVFGKEKENLLINSDFFILPSRTEGHPVALIEALSYGLPCIVSKGTNMGQEIFDYRAGWVADNSSKGIANTISTLLANSDKLKEIGKNARQLSYRYEWKHVALDAVKKYQNLSQFNN